MITVYYDDLCGMCSKEINFYKKISKPHSINWIPLSSPSQSLEDDNLKLSDALMYLHVKDSLGNFHVGVDAFLMIWSKLPIFKYLKHLVALPIVYQLAKLIYNKFAKYRFAKLAHCKIAFDKDKANLG